jgi:hypothetical protein
MRQNEETTRQNLSNQLKAIHPANIIGGIWVIRQFALNEFHNGIDPGPGNNEHPIFKEAAEMWAYNYGHSADVEDQEEYFLSLLTDYSKLLAAFATYLSAEGLTEAHTEITRIQSGLALQGLQGATLQGAPARGARWKEALACGVALAGAVLLGFTCNSKEAWQCMVGMLSLVMVAVPVWTLATRYAKRSAAAPITQPTR